MSQIKEDKAILRIGVKVDVPATRALAVGARARVPDRFVRHVVRVCVEWDWGLVVAILDQQIFSLGFLTKCTHRIECSRAVSSMWIVAVVHDRESGALTCGTISGVARRNPGAG